jgi:hypothetical protein
VAKRLDKDLYNDLRNRGLRKRTARGAASAVAKMDGRRQAPKALRTTIEDLRGALDQLEGRVKASDRGSAARKGARTRRQTAAKRSASARKGARKRSTRAGGGSRSASRSGARGGSRRRAAAAP